jgi:large subunit ribosomal protein L3
MALGLLGKKIGMTRIFTEDGKTIPVTVIEAGPCVVMNVGEKTLQLGFDDRSRNAANKPSVGLAKKAKTEPKKFIREVPRGEGDFALGQSITVSDVLEGVTAVDIIARSKGRGFAGCIKRHGFSSGPRAHGSKNVREPGSTGHLGATRSLKNIRMPGHYGDVRVTQRNLKLLSIDKENNLLLVKGSVPGTRNGYVMIRKTNKV